MTAQSVIDGLQVQIDNAASSAQPLDIYCFEAVALCREWAEAKRALSEVTRERDTLKGINADLCKDKGVLLLDGAKREVYAELLRDAMEDAVSALRYIEQTHGRLYGVGFDRVYAKHDAALAAPSVAQEANDQRGSGNGVHPGHSSMEGKATQRPTRDGVAPAPVSCHPTGNSAPSDHVAWLRYKDYNGRRAATIHLCDSDAPGAFKVYREDSKRIRAAEAVLREFDRITSGWPMVDPKCPTCGGGPVIKLAADDYAALNGSSDDDPGQDAVEAYIRGLKWSDAATDTEKTLVAGNIRGFYSWLRKAAHKGHAIGSVDASARWAEVQNIARAVAMRDDPPNEVESALCWAVTALREGHATNSVERYTGPMGDLLNRIENSAANFEGLAERAHDTPLTTTSYAGYGRVLREAAAALAALGNSRGVHVNMLRGIIAPITLRQAAHVAGGKTVEWLNRAEEREPMPTEHAQRGD